MRATSTTTNLVSIKFLTYLFMGAGSWDDLPLYIVAITCSMTGLQARCVACTCCVGFGITMFMGAGSWDELALYIFAITERLSTLTI